MDIKKLIQENEDYIVSMRRYFHENPELSFEEVETSKKVAEELEKMGIPCEIPDTDKKVGVIGVIQGGKPGKTIALRADMDALNVDEKNDVEYASKTPNKMHACGHDAHIAILLGAAKMLNEIKDEIPGKVYLIFQPAEEVGLGAKYMMEQGTWFEKTDALFGAHVWTPMPAGKVSLEGGERMAAATMFNIKVHGKSGHGSAPHETVDAVVVASAIVMNLQTLVSRTYNPLDSIALTVGTLHSGVRWNVIAGEAELTGTVRYFNNKVGEKVEADMRRVVENTAAAYGATAELKYDFIVLPTFNDKAHSDIAVESAKKVVGAENVALEEKTTGGEDFSYYLQSGKPGVFAFVGAGNPDVKADFPHHNECFNIDESILANGAGVYVQYTMDYLTQNA